MTFKLGNAMASDAASVSIECEDINFAFSLLEQAEWSQKGEATIQAQTLMTTTGTRLPIAPYNAAIRVGETPAPRVVDAAMDWFGARGRGFSLYVRARVDADVEEECCRRGLTLCATLPVMALEKARESDEMVTVSLSRVRTSREVREFGRIAAEAFGAYAVPTHAVEDAFANSARILKSSARLFLSRINNKVVGCGLLHITDGTAGLYWISVRQEFQRQGLATQMTRSLIRYAMTAGARKVVLQSSPAAVNLYRRMGFREISQLRCYCWPLRTRARSRELQCVIPVCGQNNACATRAQCDGA